MRLTRSHQEVVPFIVNRCYRTHSHFSRIVRNGTVVTNYPAIGSRNNNTTARKVNLLIQQEKDRNNENIVIVKQFDYE